MPSPSRRAALLRTVLAAALLPVVLAACGGSGTVPPGSNRPPALELAVAAPPPHGPLAHAEGYVWTRGDTVVLRHHASLDGRATWRTMTFLPTSTLPEDFVFLTDTTGVARFFGDAFGFLDLAAGTYRPLSGPRPDLSGWAVQGGYLIHMIEDVRTPTTISDETAVSYFYRLDVTDPGAAWETLDTQSLPYEPLRFSPSLHATDDGLVAVTRYGFLTSRDLGRTWTAEPAAPTGLGGALGDLNEVLVTEAGYPIVLQQANTVASYDGGATYENVGAALHARSVDWSDVEQVPGGVLIHPVLAERSDDGGRTWTPYLERPDLAGYAAYPRGDDVYLWEGTVNARALVHRPDGRVEMLLAKAPDEAGGGILTAVPLANGEVLGTVGRHLLRYHPGDAAWTWERRFPASGRLFAAGGGRVAIAFDGDDRAPATLRFSEDGGRTWGDPATLQGTTTALQNVARLAVLPDRLLAHGLRRDAYCGGVAMESFDGGATWTSLPLPGGVEGVDAPGLYEHVPTGVTSDGILFGYSEASMPVFTSCNFVARYPTRSDDAGRTWRYVDLQVGTTTHYPVAVSPSDDPITAGLWRSDGGTEEGFVLHAFLRDEARWLPLGEPRVGGRAFARTSYGAQSVEAQYGPDGRLYLTTFGEGLLRTASAVP